jgi:hypothetical protein
MKLLKIISAVFLFSFLGSMHNTLLAQPPGSYWSRNWNVENELNNGAYRARLENDATNPNQVNIVITKPRESNTPVRTIKVSNAPNNAGIRSLSLFVDRDEKDVILLCTTDAGENTIGSILLDNRSALCNKYGYKLLDSEVEAKPSAYIQLQSDGRIFIYNASTLLGGAGTPIIEL